jgi:hypothetical protein
MVKLRAVLPTTILAFVLAMAGLSGHAAAQSSGGTEEQASEAQPAAAPDVFAPPTVDSPECSWIGQRILMLLWRDDIDTAKDFIEIYDRFGCPMGHEGPAFRCLVQIGVSPEEADPGLPERAKACWQNPALDPTSFTPPQPAPTPTPE